MLWSALLLIINILWSEEDIESSKIINYWKLIFNFFALGIINFEDEIDLKFERKVNYVSILCEIWGGRNSFHKGRDKENF